jgi:hypothetical protein
MLNVCLDRIPPPTSSSRPPRQGSALPPGPITTVLGLGLAFIQYSAVGALIYIKAKPLKTAKPDFTR